MACEGAEPGRQECRGQEVTVDSPPRGARLQKASHKGGTSVKTRE
jgi:hypothetical protein